MTDACLSDLVLDEIMAGTRSRDSHRDHLEACARCNERLEVFADHQDTVGDQVEMLLARVKVAAAVTRRRRPLRWLAVATSLACAVAAVWVGVVASGNGASYGYGERTKGTAMRFVVQRGGDITRGVSGARYRAGDALRFTVSSGAPGFFLLVGIDPSGQVSVYHPFAGERSAPQDGGVDIALPGSLILDDSLETEYFLGIFSRDPIEVSRVRDAVAQLRKTLGPRDTLSVAVLDRLALPGSRHWVVVARERGHEP